PLTVRRILAHTSGLPDWLPLYREVAGKGWTRDQVREYFLAAIDRTPLKEPPGVRRIYSDLGFILLGFLITEVFSAGLGTLWREKIAERLKMEKTLFNPLEQGWAPERIAATERSSARGKLIQGEVHDDNCFVLGGEAGHAGLFGTAEDMEKFIQWILDTWAGRETLCFRQTLMDFVGPAVRPKLGWDTATPPYSQAGKYFSDEHSIGHLAFTGCSLWIDFSDQKYMVLLTNRVHPRADNTAIKKFRPRLHDLVIASMLGIS
ncbi:MAG: serine hydrolase, partial [Candidatus Binatia bacterium]